MLKLDINDLDIQQAVKAAVLAQITDEARERLVAGAIEYLLKEPDVRSGYATVKGLSPLQQAVNRAIEQFANELVQQEFKARDDFQGAVRAQLGEAVEKIVAGEWNIAEAFATALQKVLQEGR